MSDNITLRELRSPSNLKIGEIATNQPQWVIRCVIGIVVLLVLAAVSPCQMATPSGPEMPAIRSYYPTPLQFWLATQHQ
jgi:hypothetical protein